MTDELEERLRHHYRDLERGTNPLLAARVAGALERAPAAGRGLMRWQWLAAAGACVVTLVAVLVLPRLVLPNGAAGPAASSTWPTETFSPIATPSLKPTNTPAPTASPAATPRSTTTPTSAASPSSSASGPPATAGQIAYALGPEGARELHVVAPDGTGDRSCGAGMAPSWSADGGTLVFAGPERMTTGGPAFPDIYRAAADCSGVSRLIPEGTAPHLSPDGTSITFGRGVIDTGDAWIAKADGTGPRKLMAGTSPTWSPDGSWLLLNPDTGTVELGLLRPDGAGYHSLGGGNDPSWTPDGRIVYLRSDYPNATTTLRVIALDGTATDLFTATGELRSPQMLADGRVVFAWNGDAWRLDPGVKEPYRLTHGLTIVSGPSASADGRWLAAAVGGTEPGLVVVSIDGGWVRVLDGVVSAVAWQPVGQSR